MCSRCDVSAEWFIWPDVHSHFRTHRWYCSLLCPAIWWAERSPIDAGRLKGKICHPITNIWLVQICVHRGRSRLLAYSNININITEWKCECVECVFLSEAFEDFRMVIYAMSQRVCRTHGATDRARRHSVEREGAANNLRAWASPCASYEDFYLVYDVVISFVRSLPTARNILYGPIWPAIRHKCRSFHFRSMCPNGVDFLLSVLEYARVCIFILTVTADGHGCIRTPA